MKIAKARWQFILGLIILFSVYFCKCLKFSIIKMSKRRSILNTIDSTVLLWFKKKLSVQTNRKRAEGNVTVHIYQWFSLGSGVMHDGIFIYVLFFVYFSHILQWPCWFCDRQKNHPLKMFPHVQSSHLNNNTYCKVKWSARFVWALSPQRPGETRNCSSSSSKQVTWTFALGNLRATMHRHSRNCPDCVGMTIHKTIHKVDGFKKRKSQHLGEELRCHQVCHFRFRLHLSSPALQINNF